MPTMTIDERIEVSNANGMDEQLATFEISVPFCFSLPLDYSEDGTSSLPEEKFTELEEFVEAWGLETVLDMIEAQYDGKRLSENCFQAIFTTNPVPIEIITPN